MNVNCEQQHQRMSAEFYTNDIQDGNIVSNMMMAANFGNDAGALGQVLFMVGNVMFKHGTLQALRSMIANDVHHPAGSTFSEYSEMSVHGRTTSADFHYTNNRLEGLPLADL